MRQLLHILYISIILAVAYSCTEYDNNRSDFFFHEAERQETHENFDSAAIFYLQAINELDSTVSGNYKKLGMYYNRLGIMLFKSQVYNQSTKMFEQAISFNARLKDKSQLSESYRGLWKNYVTQKDAKADSIIELTVGLLTQIADRNELLLANNALAYHYYLNGNNQKALTYNTQAYLLSGDSTSVYKNYLVRGEIFEQLGDADSALFYIKTALQSDYIFTKASAAENLYRITGDTAYYTLAINLNDSISQLEKTDKISSALYTRFQQELTEDFNRKLHFQRVTTVATIIFAFLVLAIVLWQWRRKQNMQANSDPVSLIDKTTEEVQTELAEQICSILESKKRTFIKNPIYKHTKERIEGGKVFLPQQERTQLSETLQAEYALLHKLLSSHFSFSDEEFNLYCLASLDLNTKECAACRNVSDSAIRVSRKRINDKMRKFITNESAFNRIKL